VDFAAMTESFPGPVDYLSLAQKGLTKHQSNLLQVPWVCFCRGRFAAGSACQQGFGLRNGFQKNYGQRFSACDWQTALHGTPFHGKKIKVTTYKG